jgi:hypothetical protein
MAFSGSGKSVTPPNFFNLIDKENGRLIEGSLVWERLAPTLRHVHAYGCRLAKRRTQANRTSGRLQVPSVIYCGAYRLTFDAIRAIKGAKNMHEVESAEVIHKIEDSGEIAHAALLFRLRQQPTNLDATKTAIAALLWTKSVGPFRHVCTSDKDIGANHPSTVLNAGPGGTEVAPLGMVAYVRRIIRFQFDWVLWKALQWGQSS